MTRVHWIAAAAVVVGLAALLIARGGIERAPPDGSARNDSEFEGLVAAPQDPTAAPEDAEVRKFREATDAVMRRSPDSFQDLPTNSDSRDR